MTVIEKRKKSERFWVLVFFLFMIAVSYGMYKIVDNLEFLKVKHINASPSAPAQTPR